jgi:hypothetical protein
MFDPSGQLSDLPVGDSRLKQSPSARELADFLPYTSQYFEA